MNEFWSRVISGFLGGVLVAIALWLFGYFSDLIKHDPVPSGTIAMFNDKCPKEHGWIPYDAALDRFPVAAGKVYPLKETGEAAQIRTIKFRNAQTVDPNNSHGDLAQIIGNQKKIKTEPSWIALNFCMKR